MHNNVVYFDIFQVEEESQVACVTQVVQDQYESNVRAANIVSVFTTNIFLMSLLDMQKYSLIETGNLFDGIFYCSYQNALAIFFVFQIFIPS